MSILIWGLFGGVLVRTVAGALRGDWYFRADVDGPAICATTIRGECLARLPWEQVQAIVVWKAQHNLWIGVVPPVSRPAATRPAA
ncbi:hypothetical protein ACIRL2_40490 [Embleya sp. NPDC127516]|uniref:hypothetical protein n=1 Tax=Embleya sp. NPDC127516 TaxID=3363990 RepID=UPI00381BA659